MTDKSLFEHQRALHRRAEEVLLRVFTNEELMAQVRGGIAQIKRGERGTPLRELQQRRKQA